VSAPAWPEWRHHRGAYGQGEVYDTVLPSGQYLYLHCARLVADRSRPKGDRRRYRFEWRAKVWDEGASRLAWHGGTHEHGRTIASGPTSDAAKAAVAALIAARRAGR